MSQSTTMTVRLNATLSDFVAANVSEHGVQPSSRPIAPVQLPAMRTAMRVQGRRSTTTSATIRSDSAAGSTCNDLVG